MLAKMVGTVEVDKLVDSMDPKLLDEWFIFSVVDNWYQPCNFLNSKQRRGMNPEQAAAYFAKRYGD